MAGRGRGAALTVPAWMKDQAAAAPRASAPVPMAGGVAARALNGGWACALAPDGRPYWYNRETNQTTWEDPLKTIDTSNPGATATRTDATTASAVATGGVEPLQGVIPPSAALASAPRAQNWVKHTTEDGRTYYYDRFTRETRWEKPDGLQEGGVESTHDARVFAPPAKISTVAQQRDVGAGKNAASIVKTADRAALGGEGSPAPRTNLSAANGTIAPYAALGPEQLAPGWVAYTAPDGRQYYHNAALQKTTWERPTTGRELAPPTTATSASELANPSSLPGVVGGSSAQATPRPAGPARHAPSFGLGDVPGPAVSSSDLARIKSGSITVPTREAPPPTLQSLPTKRRRRTRAPPTGYVARPRDKDGKYMSDKMAEAYFLARAQKERDRLVEVERRARLAAGKGDRGVVGKRGGSERENLKSRPLGAYVHVRRSQIETSWEQRKLFEQVMRDSQVVKNSSWLETMARCTPDERYASSVALYGHRKLSYVNFVAKEARAAREAAIIATVKAHCDFADLVEECFGSEANDCLSLSACCSQNVVRFEADPRFAGVSDELARSTIIRFFFRDKERAVREKERLRVERLKNTFRCRLDEMTDPSLRLQDSRISRNLGMTSDVRNGCDANIAIVHDSNDASAGIALTTDDSAVPFRWLTERSSLREVEQRFSSWPEIEQLNPKERAEVYDMWFRDVKRAFTEKQVRKRAEAKRAAEVAEHAFIVGVESLMLEGRISFRAMWRDVASTVLDAEFGKVATTFAESKTIPPLARLFEKSIDRFYSRVDDKNDAFRAAFKAAPQEVVLKSETTVADIRRIETFQQVLDGVPDSVAAALLYERRKRELRRKEQAIAHFEELLERRSIDGGTDWEALKLSLVDRTAYKNLLQLVNDEGVKAVFDAVVARHENRRKRRAETEGEGSKARRSDDGIQSRGGFPGGGESRDERIRSALGMPPALKKSKYGPQPALPPVRVFPKKEEDSGWAAAISEKPLSDQERREELERKKREILARAHAGAEIKK